MATISLVHNHTLSPEEALKRAQDLVKEVGNRLKAEISWNGPNATFKGSGFTGNAQLRPGAIALDVDLGLLLRPMKGKIESKLEQAIQERFA